jgi:prepilin-type N-terminal cleavage/methylation domain-containing protein
MVRSPSSQSGFALIEVIVSAAVLAMVALAVLSGIDGATHASGRERARSVAASLAEQDQERLRSMTINELAGYDVGPQTTDIDGIKYTVASTTKWVRDATGNEPNCTDVNPQSDYLHVRSTVTSNVVGRNVSPVTMDSIVAPPIEYSSTTGTLVVKVTDQAAAPVAGLSVAVAGTTAGTISDTQVTNDAGCALFEHVPKGTYGATLNRPGWVDMLGVQVSRSSLPVSAGQLAILPITYAAAATVNLNVKTFRPCTTASCTPVEGASKAMKALNIINSQPMRDFPQPVATLPLATIPAANLFPFTAKAYGFWTGSCAGQNPEKTGNTGYFDAAHSALTTPAGVASKSMWQPGLNIRIAKDSAGTLLSTSTHNIDVKAIFKDSTTDGCTTAPYVLKTVTRADPGVDTSATSTNKYGWVTSTDTVASDALNTYDPGLPFGDYAICVWDRTDGRGFKVTGNYQNRAPKGNPTQLTLANTAYTSSASNSNPYNRNQSAAPATTLITAADWNGTTNLCK